MADAFTVKDMELYYGSFHALKNVNLNIASGEITAFIGPSGCGKSTFLKSLNRMNDLVEGCRITGDIRLMGEDIYDRDMDVSVLRRRVGMVFQKPNPFPMSVYDNIAYGPRTHGVKQKPEVILMDEPTSALDPISTSKIEDLVMDIKKEYTIVMVTHNMQQAVRVSDTTVFFLLGEIIESGATGQMFSMPKDKRTEDYITGRFG